VNTNGELIGINSQILSPSGGSIGLGFSIPSNMARSVMEQLVNTGRVRRGQLGIVVLPIPSEEATKLGVKEGPGVVVYQVQNGSGADRAGLRAGDVITALNGTGVTDPNQFRNAIASTPPGTEVTLTVKRGGNEQQVRATLGEFTPEAERPRDQE
jgi:S1-C subfamily serine protease